MFVREYGMLEVFQGLLWRVIKFMKISTYGSDNPIRPCYHTSLKVVFKVYKVYKTFEGIADMVMIHDLLISEACREHYKGASDHRDGTLNTSRR